LTPSFEPEAIFAALNGHGVEYVVIGGIAATLRGSPLRTGHADICPAEEGANLERLADALRALDARVLDDGTSLAAPLDALMLARATTWNLTTAKGDLDIAFPALGHGRVCRSPQGSRALRARGWGPRDRCLVGGRDPLEGGRRPPEGS
jgi:hypothetical protein